MKKLVLLMIVLGLISGYILNGKTTEKFPVAKKKVAGIQFFILRTYWSLSESF